MPIPIDTLSYYFFSAPSLNMLGAEQWTTMSITSSGMSTLVDQKRPPRPFVVKDTNRVDDIDGARSKVPYADRYCNKPPINTADIAGSVSRPLTHSRNVRDMSLYIDDIDGTRHSIKDRMMRTKRHVNPLVPEYDLPTFVPARVPEFPFLRDSMNNDEVEGSTTKPLQNFQIRDNISTNDIVGAQACWRPLHRYCIAHHYSRRYFFGFYSVEYLTFSPSTYVFCNKIPDERD